VPILIDENTRQSLNETFKVDDLGTVEIKGKNHIVRIFSVPIG
jgi:class 3 adenylate cyclase